MRFSGKSRIFCSIMLRQPIKLANKTVVTLNLSSYACSSGLPSVYCEPNPLPSHDTVSEVPTVHDHFFSIGHHTIQ